MEGTQARLKWFYKHKNLEENIKSAEPECWNSVCSGVRLWWRINNVVVTLFIAIDNQSDVKGFKMEIAEV